MLILWPALLGRAFFWTYLMKNMNPPVGPDTDKSSADSRVVAPAFGLGRFAPFNWERTPHRTAIRLFFGRIVLWLIVLAIIGWTVLATGMFLFVKYQRGFAEVRYSHMLFLPVKIDDYRRAKGGFFIKQGLDKVKEQQWREAFDLLRLGLMAVPEHREARLTLARIYLMAGRVDITRTLLIDGLNIHGNELDYLREVLGFCFSLQADDTVIALTTELRGRLAPEGSAARLVNTAMAYAYFNRAHYAEAEAALSAAGLLDTPEGRFVMARILWTRGRHAEALSRLRDLTAEVPQDYEIYHTLIYSLNEEKLWSEVRWVSLLRQLALPDQPEGYVDFMDACGNEGAEARRIEAEAAFFEHFTNDAAALFKLGELVSRDGRVKVAEQVAARCRQLGRYQSETALLWLGARLEQRDYQGIISCWRDLWLQVPLWSERDRVILGGMRGVALYGLHQDMEGYQLIRPLSETKLLQAQTLTVLATHLQRVGQSAEARRVLRHAVELDPLNQPALVLLLRGLQADAQLYDALPLIKGLLGMRNPPDDLLADLKTALNSDRYFFLPDRRQVQSMIQTLRHQRDLEK